ncbi:MAG: MFS transporter, partial [Anaerolineaceae bacterium]
MTNLALLLMINRLTGSVTAMATMSIVLMLPRLLFGFIAGVYVDRLDRQKLMVYSYLVRGALVLGFLLVNTQQAIWVFYLIGFLQGCVATFFEPSRSALLPNLVPADGLLAANSITTTSTNIFYTLGNAAAGVMIGTLDTYKPIYILNAAMFFLSALLISRIHYTPLNVQRKKNLTLSLMIHQVGQGMRLSFGNRLLGGTLAAMSLTMLGMGAVNVLLTPFIINDLGISAAWMGATGISQMTAMVISGSIIAGLASRISPIRFTPFTLIGFGLAVMTTFFAKNIWQVAAILFLQSLFVPGITSFTQTILQVTVPDMVRGRVNSARMVLVMTASLISMGAAGVLADKVGTATVFLFSGAFAVLGGLAAMLIFKGEKL